MTTCEEDKIYVNQIGVLIEAETQKPGCPLVDWTNATLWEILLQLPPPSNLVVAYPATLDGTKLSFLTTEKKDLPVRGNYKYQSHVVGPGYDAKGVTASFRVYDNFK